MPKRSQTLRMTTKLLLCPPLDHARLDLMCLKHSPFKPNLVLVVLGSAKHNTAMHDEGQMLLSIGDQQLSRPQPTSLQRTLRDLIRAAVIADTLPLCTQAPNAQHRVRTDLARCPA